ncbi:unnamed protein product [Musa banksii]
MMHPKAVFDFFCLVFRDVNRLASGSLDLSSPHVLMDVLRKISCRVCTCKNLDLDAQKGSSNSNCYCVFAISRVWFLDVCICTCITINDPSLLPYFKVYKFCIVYSIRTSMYEIGIQVYNTFLVLHLIFITLYDLFNDMLMYRYPQLGL